MQTGLLPWSELVSQVSQPASHPAWQAEADNLQSLLQIQQGILLDKPKAYVHCKPTEQHLKVHPCTLTVLLTVGIARCVC